MSKLILGQTLTPANPDAGKVEMYASSDTTPIIRSIDTSGNIRSLSDIFNYSVVLQTLSAGGARVLVVGGQFSLPVTKLQIGTIFKWKVNITKTGTNSTNPIFDVSFGTNGTTSDTARLTFTLPNGTATADEGWVEITAIVRGPLSTAGVAVGELTLAHNLRITGLANIPFIILNAVSAAFNVVTPTYVQLCATPASGDTHTIQIVTAEATGL